MRPRSVLLCAVAFLFVVGCTQSEDSSILAEAATLNTPSLTATPVTPTASISSIYEPLRFSESNLDVTGSIWVLAESNEQYLRFDLIEAEKEVVDRMLGCSQNFLSKMTEVICANDGTLAVYDIVTGASESLEIATPDWLSATPNGRFLYYGYLQPGQLKQHVEIYDLSLRQITSSGQLDYSNWYGSAGSDQPSSLTLSADGKYFAVLTLTDAFVFGVSVIDTQLFSFLDLALPEELIEVQSAGLLWSPSGNHLLIASGLPFQQYGSRVNKLFAYEPKLGFRLISAPDAPSGFFDFSKRDVWWPKLYEISPSLSQDEVWAPDGRSVLMFYHEFSDGLDEQIGSFCIFGTIQSDQRCVAVWFPYSEEQVNYYSPYNFVWSPDSKYLAFLVDRIRGTDLFIYDTSSGAIYLVDEYLSAETIFWSE